MGGNVNYAFCVQHTPSTTQFFVKQAPEYVAIFGPDGLPLSSQRMQREMDVYEEWSQVLAAAEKNDASSSFLPTIYFFDPLYMVVGMEFLDGYELLDHVIVSETAATAVPALAGPLGIFMGQVHAATHASQVTAERKKYLTEHFENRPVRI